MSGVVPTAEFASLVYGAGGVAMDDPAETFHEASRLYPSLAPGRLTSLLDLAASPELQQTLARASRTHAHRPAVDLPPYSPPGGRLSEALRRRRSAAAQAPASISLGQLSTVLGVSYAAAEIEPGVSRRLTPSGGALYPLELYVLALAVEGLGRGVYHYHPFRHGLECLTPDPADVRTALVDPALADGAAAIVVVTAMFWRSRFKYGARGYRFALIEAGHVVQNAVLAAAALELSALPVGGFYDRRVDSLVGADGLDEATVYVLVLGGRA